MNIEYDLLKTKFTEEEGICSQHNCTRRFFLDDNVYIDIRTSNILCSECGQCERYTRKKEKERLDLGIYETPLIKGLDY